MYKCERFFKYNEVLEQEEVRITSIHLESKALDWFQGYEASVKELNWKMFATDIMTQFGQGMYDNPIGQITKLRQASPVHIYHEQFEALMVKTRGLTKCFVSSLRDAIKNQVMMFQPTTLS